MSAADGTVIGITKIVDSGTPSSRWNLVIVAEGYQAAQLGQFATHAQDITDRLLSKPPFDAPEIQCGINVYRLDVASTDAGADKPGCADDADGGEGDPIFKNTYFDATYCFDGGPQRLLAGDSTLAQTTVEQFLPEWDQILVICNDLEYGGAGGEVAWTSIGNSFPADWRDVAIHEMGHSQFNLADEYDDLPGPHTGGEPDEPNATIDPDPSTCKWSALVTAGPDVPTRANPDCDDVDPGPSPVPAGTVGTFEGADRHHCGVFRPVWTCMMRDTTQPFCPVCTEAIVATMSQYAQPAPSGDVALATPLVNFNDVPTGLTVVRAARFDVSSCVGVTFQTVSAPSAPFALESAAVLPVSPSGPTPWRAYVWFRMTAGAVGPVASQDVIIQCLETGENFEVTLTGNVVERPSVATQLVFDQSGSMLDMTDEGRTKEQVLKDAATVFTDLLWDDNGIGINAYDHDPHPIMDVEVAGAPGDGAGRDHAVAAIAAHASNLYGMTAIGDGIELARQKLDEAPGTWDHKAMIVLTDGIETAAQYVSDVADSIVNEKVFAIGMGTAEQIQPATLDSLTAGTGGYLLMTGNLSQDETFLLEKYYIQILAGVNNNELVLDPEGWARTGVTDRIAFYVTDSDVEITAMVVGRPAYYLRIGLETPEGIVIGSGHPSLLARRTARTIYMRAGLPLMSGLQAAHAGRWHLLLGIDPKFYQHGTSVPGWSGPPKDAPGIHYSAAVSAYSNLRMSVAVHQTSREPGATLTVRAVLTEYGVPFGGTANVQAELTRPDGSEVLLSLPRVSREPGAYQTTLTALQSGIYRFRFLASGRTSREHRFTREALRTAAVWRGGDHPTPGNGGRPDDDRPSWCDLLACVLDRKVLSDDLVKRLHAAGVDIATLRECLASRCGDGSPKPATAVTNDLRNALQQILDGL